MAGFNKIWRFLGVASAASLMLAAAASHAVEKGDWLIRAGAGHVAPDDSSSAVTGVPGSRVEVDGATSLAVNFTYMLSDRWGVELLGALPFKHDIQGAGSISGLGRIAEAKQLPPTLVLLYSFAPKSGIRPYAGIGLNHTFFFGEKVTGDLKALGLADDISLESSTGLAAEVGVDVDIGPGMFFNASLWRMDIETTATLKGGALDGARVDVDVAPWVYFVGLGWKF